MNQADNRYHFIDWIRVLAFFTLIVFHCAMPFVHFGWEIKNKEQSLALTRFIWWLHQWRLPLLFFISGAGIHFSLQRRTVSRFAGERFVRLFIPLAFAMLCTIPLQVYFEWMQTGRYHGTYAAFYPSVWEFVPYPEGSLTWSHMWFVVYLFVFCLLLLPVFALLKLPKPGRLKNRAADFFTNPLKTFLLVVPLFVCYLLFFIRYPEQQNLVEDWFVFSFSLIILLYGYMLSNGSAFWQGCAKYRFVYLGAAAICTFILYIFYWWDMEIPKHSGPQLFLYGFLNSVHIWSLICAVVGFAARHLNFSNRFLRYNNQAVYPFFILHQTIIVVTGYYVVQWPLPWLFKLLILIFLCFLAILIIYRWLIRPFSVIRILFGLKKQEV